jgi:hypothetical protein
MAAICRLYFKTAKVVPIKSCMLSGRNWQWFTGRNERTDTAVTGLFVQSDHLLPSNTQTKARYGMADEKKQVHNSRDWWWRKWCQYDQHGACRSRNQGSLRRSGCALLRLRNFRISNPGWADAIPRPRVISQKFTAHSFQLLQELTSGLATILVWICQQFFKRLNLRPMGVSALQCYLYIFSNCGLRNIRPKAFQKRIHEKSRTLQGGAT